MKGLFKYILIIAIFFSIGKMIANSEKSIFSKNNNRLKNNYYGNIISMIGFIFLFAKNFGINNFLFFALSSICVAISYCFHLMDYTGENFEGIIDVIFSGKKTIFFKKQTISLILAILVSGIISTTFFAPILKQNKKEVSPPVDMNTSVESQEPNFDNYFY